MKLEEIGSIKNSSKETPQQMHRQIPIPTQGPPKQVDALAVLQQLGTVTASLIALQTEVMQMGKVLATVSQHVQILDAAAGARLAALEKATGVESPNVFESSYGGVKDATDKEGTKDNAVDDQTIREGKSQEGLLRGS